MTAPIAPVRDTLPKLPRPLSPDEFEHAQTLTPSGLAAAEFPTLPPAFKAPEYAPKDAVDQDKGGIQKPGQLTGLGRILTQYVAEPIMTHPLTTAVTAVTPGAGYLMAGLMGSDILNYAAQRAAELSLPSDVQKLAEQDPSRISGEQAAVEAAMLGLAPAVAKGVEAVKGARAGPPVGEIPARIPSMQVVGDAPASAPLHMVERAKTGGPADMAIPANVKPRFSENVKRHVDEVADSWQSIFAPANRSPEASQAAGILRATTGEAAAQYEQAAFKLDQFRRAIDPLPEADKLGFIDAIEGGRSQPSPEFNRAAVMIRRTLDDAREAVQNLGTGKLENFIENYFPHIWEDPERAATAFKSSLEEARASAGTKRPMEGSKSFLKQRTIPTTLDGLQMGLKPVTTNPVDLTLLKLREMQRYTMAHQSLHEMKGQGLVKYVRAGEQAPDGYRRIDDKIATVFGPREGAVTLPEGANIAPEEVGVLGRRIMGEYWAPAPVAKVVNNYLSPGLRGNALYDAYRGLGNVLNQAQLGLSAFHLMFTSMDASVSRAALGIEYIGAGKPMTGLRKSVSAPAAPVTNMILGAKVRRAYLNPEAASPEMRALANAVQEAGGRVRMDSFYKNSAPERMVKAWKDAEYGKAAALSLPSLFELASKPIMEHIVPLQKLGVFGDLARFELERMPPEATLTERRAVLAKAWDSVDNRMGQLVYDNLFWSKTFKDLAMASVRSVGWNIGTIRELGGGMLDVATEGSKALRGKPAELTHRAAYVMALPITVGMYGALYQYLRTGEGPTEPKDYFYPKTGEVDADGNPERVQIASYMKDFFSYHAHPWETVKHKVNPGLAAMYEMLQNEDYYGDQIRHPDDPAVKQIQQEAEFIGKQVLPFSLRNMTESTSRGDQTTVTKFGNWFGITPAPRDAVRSDAQNRMGEILKGRGTTSGSTPEIAEARRSRRELLNAIRTNDGSNTEQIQQAVTDALERHQLTPKEVVTLLKRAGTTPAAEKFKSLTLEEAVEVFKLSTPREQALFAEALLAKIQRKIRSAE